MSKAVERPVLPLASRYLKRALVSSGVPKPANMRIVHSRPRYMVACTPRVKGNWPGRPRDSCVSARLSAAVRMSGMGMPESVVNDAARNGVLEVALASVPACQRAVSRPTVRMAAPS